MNKDYRYSHISQRYGQAYHEKFENNKYRAMIWKIEQGFLQDIHHKFFHDKDLLHFDFACGTGRILNFFEKNTKKSLGVDVSASMLEIAKKNCKNACIVQEDLTKNDVLGDQLFNLITAFRFFPNAQPKLRIETITILKKHLREDGYLIFNNHKCLTSTRLRIAKIIGRQKIRGMRHSEVEQLLAHAGLCIVKTYHTGVFPSSENRQIIPLFLLTLIETIASKYKPLEFLAENILYVCAHNPVKR